MQEEDNIVDSFPVEGKVRRAHRINISVPNNEILAYREISGRERLNLVRRTLKESPIFQSIIERNEIGTDRRILLDIFNYGFFNVIGSVNVDGGNDSPLSIAVISRPEGLKEKRGSSPVEVTKADYKALQILQERGKELINKYESEDNYYPVTRMVGLDEVEAQEGERMVIMHNEVVGGKPLFEDGPWGSNEVNLVVWNIEGQERMVFILNNATALNPSMFESYYDLCDRAWKMPRQNLDDSDRADLEELTRLSDVLKEGYVAALAAVWFLSGAVPEQFNVNAGDGVIDGTREAEDGNRSVSDYLKLITIRGGLSKAPYLSDGARGRMHSEFDRLSDFIKYLLLLSSENPYPKDWRQDEKLVSGKEMLLFSEENVERGMRLGLLRLFGDRMSDVVEKLQKEKTLENVWGELGLGWKAVTTSG